MKTIEDYNRMRVPQAKCCDRCSLKPQCDYIKMGRQSLCSSVDCYTEGYENAISDAEAWIRQNCDWIDGSTSVFIEELKKAIGLLPS